MKVKLIYFIIKMAFYTDIINILRNKRQANVTKVLRAINILYENSTKDCV